MLKMTRKIRNPKSEIRSKFEIRILNLFRISCFGFLILAPTLAYAAEAENSLAQCQALRVLRPVVCEVGGPFLCINTPPGSVKEDFVVVKGRLNLETNVLGQLSVAMQHDYTKQLQTIALSQSLTDNCWNQNLSKEKNFCLEKNGAFAVRVPLGELGPYTLFVAASRLQGGSQQATARTSRVIAPSITPDVVTYELGATHLKVTLDLLKGCGDSKETCDFIGASTGGVLVTVDNQISGAFGKSVRCETNSIEGGAGRFVIGVPVEVGLNQLTLTICNAVTGFDKTFCPKIVSRTFEVGGVASKIEILPPLSDGPLLWDASTNAAVSLRFKIPGYTPKVCDDSVRAFLNLKDLKKVCPNADGIYEVLLSPEVGYNIAMVEANLPTQKLVETVAFGWGKPFSPFDSKGQVRSDEELKLSQAMQFWLSKDYFNRTLLPRFNQFLGSDNFKTWLADSTEDVGRGKTEPTKDSYKQDKATLLSELGFCPKGGVSTLRIKVMKPPQIGKVMLTPFQFSQNKMEFSLEAQDVSLAVQLYKDENGDGLPDIDPLPLKIAFKHLKATPILQQAVLAGKKTLTLGSSFSDCDYKRKGACYGMPALFVPSQFEGGASTAGAFAVCDESQKVSGKMNDICRALNVMDRQTGGVLQEKILDALNSAYACQGTAVLAANFQKGIPFQKETDFFGITGKIGADEIKLNDQGMSLSLNTRFGDKDLFGQWPEELRLRGAGILVAPQGAQSFALAPTSEGLSLGVSLPLVSQLFWGLHGPQGGNFSLAVDEGFFKKQGFDFETKCQTKSGEKGEPNALCKIRPRALEIFGTTFTDQYGYLEQTAPLKLILSPSRAFPLRVSALDSKGTIGIEFADWELAIESQKSRIIVALVSLKLVLQTSPPILTANDPEHFHISLKPIVAKSRWWLTEKPGTNTTVIPGPSLLGDLEGKLNSAIDFFSHEGNEIKVTIPRSIDFPTGSLFSKLGLGELVLGQTGFELGWEPESNHLLLQIVPVLE